MLRHGSIELFWKPPVTLPACIMRKIGLVTELVRDLLQTSCPWKAVSLHSPVKEKNIAVVCDR